MFQRQTRAPFPARTLVLFVLALLAFIFILARNNRNSGPSEEDEEAAKGGSGLWPAEWFYAIRNYPSGTPDVTAFTKAMQNAGLQAADRGGLPGFSSPWTVQGPGNIGARINCIEVHPTNKNIIYLGYSGGGVWKTIDGGQSWKPVFDDQSFLSVSDITLDPQNPDIVYVGTGDMNIGAYVFIGDGIWKSTNGGETWQKLGLENQRIITHVIVHPTNSNIIYAAAMGLPFQRNNDRGLYKTTDGGKTWQQVLFVSNQTGIIDLVMSPTNPNTLFAASWDRIRSNKESLVTGPNAKIWKTSDGGQTWTALTNGLPSGIQCRIGLAIDPNNPNRVVSTYANTSLTFDALYETVNDGQLWTKNAGAGLDQDVQSNFAWYFGKVAINPFNSNDIWVLGVTSYRTLDGGKNWYEAAGFGQDVHADHHDLVFLNPTTFLLATDGGLYKTTDNAVSWIKAENIPATQFYRVAYNPFEPELAFGGAQDNGTLTGSQDIIDDWVRLYGGDGFQPQFHPLNPDVFYFEWQNGNIVGSYDGGQSIFSATDGIEPTDRRHWDMQYIISPSNPEIMYTGTYRVYQKTGHGEDKFWEPISDDLTDGIVLEPRFHNITGLDESPLDPKLLYVGTTDANVWRGNPVTKSWTNISAGLPERYVSSVKASPNFKDNVYATFTGYRDNDFTAHVYRSVNQGASWTSIAGNLPNLAINDIIILPGHQDSVLFVGTDGGVWGSLNGGKNWERLGTNFPIVPVYDMTINAEKHTLVAGTHARSILSFPLDSLKLGVNVSTYTPPGSKPPAFTVMPTLADQQINLRLENLSIKKTAEVFISDLNGRILATYTMTGGARSEQSVDVSAFAPGIYVAFVRTDASVWAQKKFVVAR